MATARLRGVAPSEVLRIGCSWCAYCLDEALAAKANAAEMVQAKRMEQANEAEAMKASEDHYQQTGRVRFG